MTKAEGVRTPLEGIVVDALCATPYWDEEAIREYEAGGVSCVHITLAIWEDARQTLSNIADFYHTRSRFPSRVSIARTTADINAASRAGRTAFLLGFQNGSPFEDDLSLVEAFFELGVRVAQLTYNLQNLIGGSCYEPQDSGLTRFGHNVVGEMNRVGMIVDLSHVGETTSRDAIECSSRPVAITHSNPSFQFSHPRNKSAEILKALAARDGVLGCTPGPHFMGPGDYTLKDFTTMILRTIEVMGIEHVGIGFDRSRHQPDSRLQWIREGRWTFTPDWGAGSPEEGHKAPIWPAWVQSVRDMPSIGTGLSAEGLSDAEVAMVLGGNWMRLFEENFG